MEERNSLKDWQFSPLAINWMANNASGLLGCEDANQRYIVPAGACGTDSGPHVPQWMYCFQAPQTYVEFLAERAYPEIQKQVPYVNTARIPTLGLADPSQLEEYLRPLAEGNLIAAFKGSGHQFEQQSKNCNEECSHVLQDYSGSSADASKQPSTARQKRSRVKAYAVDRCRRLRISHWLDALQGIVPRPKEIGKAALLDDVIDYVKYLQYQVKDLCRSRLGGESSSNSLIFIEGHGHYIVQEHMLNGPLEEMMGKLINVYPSAATELLQSKGLIVMPMTFAEGLLEPTQMLDIQGTPLSFQVLPHYMFPGDVLGGYGRRIMGDVPPSLGWIHCCISFRA